MTRILPCLFLMAMVACKPEPVAPPAGTARPAREAPDVTVRLLTGAGATFPYPLYARWAHDFRKHSGVQVNYQSIGSGGGIRQIQARTVDFGATDAPLSTEELDKSGLVQFPMIIGGVVPVVRLPGVAAGALLLDGPTLADLYLGRITRWNDPRIAALNPGLRLPDLGVVTVYRADGSGTTWIFTGYLSKVSDDFRAQVGHDKSVAWPAGVGGKGNEGVAAYVQRVAGAIGYVEYAYALQNKLTDVQLRNADGAAVAPSLASFQAAASHADWANTPDFQVQLIDRPGPTTWPIVGASFILLHRNHANTEKARDLLRFFDYGFRVGDSAARELHYVPLPTVVYHVVEAAWARRITAEGRPVWKADMAGR